MPVTANCRKAATIWPTRVQRQAVQRRQAAQRQAIGGGAVQRRASGAAAAARPLPDSAAATPASTAGERLLQTGKSTLPADAKAAVDAAAAYAKAHPDAKFTLSGFTDATRVRRPQREDREEPRRSRARRAESSRHCRRPYHFEKAGNDHGRHRRERSPACSDQPGCLTCSWSAPQYSL